MQAYLRTYTKHISVLTYDKGWGGKRYGYQDWRLQKRNKPQVEGHFMGWRECAMQWTSVNPLHLGSFQKLKVKMEDYRQSSPFGVDFLRQVSHCWVGSMGSDDSSEVVAGSFQGRLGSTGQPHLRDISLPVTKSELSRHGHHLEAG